MRLDGVDEKLLERLQRGVPLVRRPFQALGRELGIGDVLERVRRLKEEGLIREIAGIFQARALGYKTALVALKVRADGLEDAARAINPHPGVSHNYAREHDYNLWFTLAVPPEIDLRAEALRLGEAAGAEDTLFLPTLQVFKIGVLFSTSGQTLPVEAGDSARPIRLSEPGKQAVRALQQDLPLEEEPFAALAERVGLEERTLLAQARRLKERGAMRRYAALLRHRKMGFSANALGCWAVPEGEVGTVGRHFAALPQVSHCYQRPTYPHWQYSLFTMTHAPSREECLALARQLSRETGTDDYLVLFSTREFKKENSKYFW